MGRRQRVWAKAARKRLMLILGDRCAACGAGEDLTFDCVAPRGDAHHGGNAEARILFYLREMRCGNVQVLCAACNALKGDFSQKFWMDAVALAKSRLLREGEASPPGSGTSEISQQIRRQISRVLGRLAASG